jgi:hypothetical protein
MGFNFNDCGGQLRGLFFIALPSGDQRAAVSTCNLNAFGGFVDNTVQEIREGLNIGIFTEDPIRRTLGLQEPAGSKTSVACSWDFTFGLVLIRKLPGNLPRNR